MIIKNNSFLVIISESKRLMPMAVITKICKAEGYQTYTFDKIVTGIEVKAALDSWEMLRTFYAL